MERKTAQLNPYVYRNSLKYNQVSKTHYSEVSNSIIDAAWFYSYSYDESYRETPNIGSRWQYGGIIMDQADIYVNSKSILSDTRWTLVNHHIRPFYNGVCKFFED